jgi:regulator of sigma E protease
LESGNALNNLVGVLGIGLTFGFAIFVHELGHFLAARLRGVGVEAFAIGMGPKIFAWTRGGTEYSLRWFPVGGFVKLHQMVREEAEETEAEARALEAHPGEPSGGKSIGQAAHEDMAALYDKGLITKLMVFSAGVFFNFLAAIAAVTVIFSIGFDEPLLGPAWVGELPEDSQLAEAGLRQGDTLVEVEGKPIEDLAQIGAAFQYVIDNGLGADGVASKVLREGEVSDLVLPVLSEETAESFFSGLTWDSKPYIGVVMPLSPAARAGFQEDDLIVEIDDQPIESWTAMSKVIRASMGEAVVFEIAREGEPDLLALTVVPEEDPGKPGTGIIGIAAGSGLSKHVNEPFTTALVRAPGRTLDRLLRIAWLNYDFIRNATFKEIKANVAGPVAIANHTFNETKKGLIPALWWFVNLNLLLAIMNLLPIPVLDGGFIVLSVIEAVIRRPVPTKILNPVYTFFALCFITLLVLVSYQDVLKVMFG